jgi:hypothetical protein
MPAKSRSQQRLFGMALAVRRGELKRSEVNDSVIKIVDSDMTDKQIEDFAKTKGLRENLKSLKEYIIEKTSL